MKTEEKIEVIIEDDRIIIEGLELKPYWKKLILAIFWWKHPKFIIKNPKIFYKSKGELIALYG